MSELDPLAPDAAVSMYLSQREGEVSDQTLQSHRYRLKAFAEWCEENGIHNMNDVSGRDLHAYRVERREEDDLKPVTLQGQLSTLRVFLAFCASIDAVPEGLPDKIMLPTVSGEDEASETTLDPARAETALDYLRRYHYASREHVTLLLLWRTGMRRGSARALDLRDCDLEGDAPALRLVHRPKTDTPLKNKERGERWVALNREIAQVLRDYVSGPREGVTDDHGRDPLLSTDHGRVSLGTIQRDVYRVTRPCWVGNPCPHDENPETCDAASGAPSGCPSSRSPHDVRSGAITAHLLDDVPVEIVSDRCDVTSDVLDRHYDRRTARERMEQRREYLEVSN